MAITFEDLPLEIRLLILSYVPLPDYYWIKQVGSRALTEAIRDIFSRTPQSIYLQVIRDDHIRRHGLRGDGRRPPTMEVMIARGQRTLLLEYQSKYADYANQHTPAEYDIHLIKQAKRGERRCYTPVLQWAVYYGQEEIVQDLLDRVHIRGGRLGQTALHIAAHKNDVKIADLLLRHGAYINALDDQGKTPLGVAMENEANKAVEFLRSRGALEDLGEVLDQEEWAARLPDPTQPWEELRQIIRRYLSPRSIQYKRSLRLFWAYLQAHETKDSPDFAQDRRALFRCAVSDQNPAIMSFALDEGEHVDVVVDPVGDGRRRTALHVAAFLNNRRMTELLLERKANTSITCYRLPIWGLPPLRETPMQYALMLGHTDVSTLYFDRGFSVDTKNESGQTALHLAATQDLRGLVECLVNRGANIRETDSQGNTPLHLAMQPTQSRIRLVKQLLESGADVEARNYDGYTPLMLAITKTDSLSFEELLDCLTAHGADPHFRDRRGRGAFHYLAQRRHGWGKVATALLQLGVDVHTTDRDFRSALHEALHHNEDNEHEYARMLIDLHVDVNTTDIDGQTALHEAAQNESRTSRRTRVSPVWPLLLERVANVDAQDKYGRSALHIILSHNSLRLEEKMALCELLLEHGASVNLEDKAGETSFICALRTWPARSMGNVTVTVVDLVELLIAHGANACVTDGSGRSALELAKSCGEEVEHLVEQAIKSQDPGPELSKQVARTPDPGTWYNPLRRLANLFC